MSRPDPRSPARTDHERDVRERVLASVRTARERIETERSEVDAELRAIDAFIDRVESLATTVPAPASGPGPAAGAAAVAVPADPPGADLAAVRTAYRETIMGVDHYDRVYGDGLAESIAAELGPELAVAVGDGAGGTLTPQLRDALVGAASGAREDRTAFVETLEEEAESVRSAADALGDLVDGPDDTDARIDRLDRLVRRRQDRLNRRPGLRRTDGHDLCSYLYVEPDWTYPVLAAAARLRAALDAPG